MNNVVDCTIFEILFSKDSAILSFSCEDIGREDDQDAPADNAASSVIPGIPTAVAWTAKGWDVDFSPHGQAPDRIRFLGVPEEVLARVAKHPSLLVVGLSRGASPLSPEISLSGELALPTRS